jgi:hypothetical protein
MNRLPVVGTLAAVLFLVSVTAALSVDVPKWWIGPQNEYEQLVSAAKNEGNLVWWSHPDPECRH